MKIYQVEEVQFTPDDQISRVVKSFFKEEDATKWIIGNDYKCVWHTDLWETKDVDKFDDDNELYYRIVEVDVE